MVGGSAQVERVRLDSLTSLRFFAAMLVLGHHFARALMPSSVIDSVSSVGFVGVSFFFVLSGFVLMWTYQPALPVRHFYARRLARIYPMHLLTAIIAIGLLLQWRQHVGVWESLTNLLLVQAWIPAEHFAGSLNIVAWSLSCELFFYLCFPYLASRAQRWNLTAAAAVTAAIVLIVAVAATLLLPAQIAAAFLYANPAYRMGEFVFGVLLALAIRRGYRPRIPVWLALALLACGYLAALALSFGWGAIGLPPAGMKAFATMAFVLGACATIAAVTVSDLEGRPSLFRRAPLVRLGEASFALYMIHLLIAHAWIEWIGSPESLRASVLLAAGLTVVSVAASLAMYRWFEKPIERVLRRRFGTPPVPSTVTPGQPAADGPQLALSDR